MKNTNTFPTFKLPFDDLKTHSDWLPKQILGILEKIKWQSRFFSSSHRSLCLKAVLTLRKYVYASCIVHLLKLFWLKNCRKTMCCSQWTMKNICTFEKSERLFIYSHRQSVFCPRERYLLHSICCHRYKYVANRMYMIFFTQYSLFIKHHTHEIQ